MFKEAYSRLKRWELTPGRRRTGLLVATLIAVLVVPGIAHAGIIDWFLQIVAKFFEIMTRLVGLILFLEVKALIEVAQYSNFVSPGPTAVQVGWVVTRDLANMFFILILLLIAFSVIVGYEEYNLRSTLPRLLIMAVVINFSKTITGILIDAGQVFMLTFVNGFKDAAGGNFLSAFQVDKLLRLSQSGSLESGGLVLGMMLAFIMVSIAAAVVLIMLVTLIFRFVFLWVLIILSPLAFLASTIPAGKTYYNDWWSNLKKYIIYGPVVSFFLWLALLTAQLSNGNIAEGEQISQGATGAAQQEITQFSQSQGNSGEIPSQAAQSDVFISMIVFTALLFAGLKVATETGGAVASITGGIVKKGLKTGLRSTFGAVPRATGAVLRGFGGGVQKGISMIPLAKNKYARGVQRAVQGTVGLAAGALHGAGTVASVQGRRLGGTGGLAKIKQAITGSAKEVAEVSPQSLAQRARHASGKDAIETAKELEGNEEARGQAIKSGSMLTLQQQLAYDGKKDSSAKSAADSLAKYVVGDLEGEEQQKTLKKMKVEDIPKEAYASKEGEGPSAVAQHVMERIGKNPAAADDVAEGAMGEVQKAFQHELKTLSEDKDMPESVRNQKIATLAVDAISTGALTAEDIQSNKNGVGDALGASLNPSRLLRRAGDSADPAVNAAATAAMGVWESQNPGRASKLRAGDEYGHIMPPAPVTAVTEDQIIGEEPLQADTPPSVASSVADAYSASTRPGAGPVASAAVPLAQEVTPDQIISEESSAPPPSQPASVKPKIQNDRLDSLKKSVQSTRRERRKTEGDLEKLEYKKSQLHSGDIVGQMDVDEEIEKKKILVEKIIKFEKNDEKELREHLAYLKKAFGDEYDIS